MARFTLVCISIVFFSAALCAQTLELKMQRALDSIFQAHPKSVGLMVHVEAPEHGISWSGASGYSNQETKTALEADQPALIASSIKTYIAATILRLVEEEKLNLEQSIEGLLTDETANLFSEDGYDLQAIQVKHLLSHTSGIEDYANQAYIDFQKANPQHHWSRQKQLERTVQLGAPLAGPGEHFSYADANYLLLTEIIEQLTGLPFYTAIRQLLRYEELGIKQSWFPTLEKEPTGIKPLAHQYWGAYNWDAYDIDISWDLYGGGGIACPTADLAKFSYHFFNGDIVKDEAIRDLIYTEIRTPETDIYAYYLGLSQDSYHGMTAYGHGGFWGTVVLYLPAINTSVAIYVLERDERRLRRDVMDAITGIIKEQVRPQLNKDQEIQAYLDTLSDFSGTVLVAQNDQLIAEKAEGLASIEYQVPNQLNTRFNIASISKTFTAVATLQLYEQEKLALDVPIGTYLPDYPNERVRDSVTIQQILTHTSGLQPFYGRGFLAANKLDFDQVADFVPLFVNDPLAFSPGTDYKYSGSGFVLLGLIIEKVSGMDYYDYVDQNIFQKAGMFHSLAIPTDSIVLNKASGYTQRWGDQNHLSRNDYYQAKASPAGSHFSTAHDLWRFSQALRNNALLNPETTALMLQPKVRGYNTHLGYGIDIDQRYDQLIIGHSGGWFGVRTEWMDFLGSDHTVIVLSNQDDDGKTGASRVIDDLKEMLAGKRK